MAPILVSTRAYHMAHGKAPRGKGMWAFFFVDAAGQRNEEAWWARRADGNSDLNYGEALKLARAEAKRRGATVIAVGS